MFEANPTVASLVGEYLKSHGKYYASSVLGPVVRAISKEPKALELHPKRVSGDELQANATRLKKLLGDVTDAIFESTVIAPQSVVQLCNGIFHASTAIQAKAAVKVDPKSDVTSVLFFHLFIPALLQLDEFNIVPRVVPAEAVTPALKRNLYLLSLALRGVARRQKADEKSGEEWFVGPLDDAVLKAADQVVPFVTTMCGDVNSPPAPRSLEDKFPASLRQQDLDPFIHRLDKNLLQLTPAFAHAGATDLILSVGNLVQGYQTLTGRSGRSLAGPVAPAKSAPESWNDDD